MSSHIPAHVAVVMDGNGRWAKARFLPRVEGHRRGMAALKRLTEAARKAGIRHLTVFAFSSENWKRPADEVNALMRFFVDGLTREAEPLREAGIRLHVVGDTKVFSPELQAAIRTAEQMTEGAQAMTLNICANYGGRWDVVDAVNRLVRDGKPVTVETVTDAVSMQWAGPVDLMIRTGGEQRISNFLLWQLAYAELWFTEVLWPDFSEADFNEALTWFAGRERRFGRTGDQVKNGG
ncbi:MAG: di-trans,poly-cis-decaprenylcistransferase [Sutterella sp.]|uniref:polyprenyl diphosphate synthase n=1 Tax=Duodenibacillus massiliensis TaxID=1852381 RepID=UPI000337B6E8|nr:polyprenyl diphosphate synthase [Duodenibacillus massiliensis]MBS5792339.1 di-trans,poly-cis-decaprenylcistransferase [Sutterella sp.]CDD70600.1 isoprenyl transferase [Sutterella sp. CAG:397]HAF65734.1 di-trans,poly-cis-decaprenylcistransferase [Sutterella sp.]